MTVADRPLSSLQPIQTARLYLRPCHIGDAGPFQAMTDDPAIAGAIDFLRSRSNSTTPGA